MIYRKALPYIIILLITVNIFLSVKNAFSEEQKKLLRVVLTANHMAGDEKANFVHLWNNVKIQQGNILVTSSEATYDMDSKIFKLSGDVIFTKPGTVITGDRVIIYEEEQRGLWEGSVKLVQDKNTDEDISEREEDILSKGPITLTCESLEFFWGDQVKAIAKGNLIVNQKDRYIYSDRATYTENPQILILEGRIQIEDGKGRSFRCDKLTLNLKREEIFAQGLKEQTGFIEIEIPLKPKKTPKP